MSESEVAAIPFDSIAALPSYNRAQLKTGIVHLGPGAFFRAHTAFYTDAAIGQAGGDWGIAAVSLRSAETVDQLAAQDGLYALLTRDGAGTSAQIVGSVVSAFPAPRDPARLIVLLTDPATKIVSLTVTEKAYGLGPNTGGLDENHPDIAADLKNPKNPRSAVGILVEGLSLRRAAGTKPFTPLSCDNLPGNGHVLRRLVLDFAERREPALARWIAENVPFPSTMVDRITPASTSATIEDAERLTGRRDAAAVETEPFAQWIIENRFADGRPAWDAAGALFVADVTPYEKMKLRMLNGAHSLIAYLGFFAGHEFVRDVMDDPIFAPLVAAHMEAAAGTLDPVPGIDLAAYAQQLRDRFANKAIAHKTYQIAMDGTQKLPQRLVEPALELVSLGRPAPTYALAVAAWMRYALGVDRAGHPYDLRDPRAGEIASLLAGVSRDGAAVSAALFSLPGLFPERLCGDPAWRDAVSAQLGRLLAGDVAGAITAAIE